MLNFIRILITLQVFFSINSALSSYLYGPNGFFKSRHDRNIVNKGVWIRTNTEPEAPVGYIFRGNNVDVENAMQGDFAFSETNVVPNSPFITSYVDRSKRSAKTEAVKDYNQSRYKKSMMNDIEDPSLIKSKFLSKLKPASVFNDYPYEIAILLGNNKNAINEAKNYSAYVINEIMKNEQNTTHELQDDNSNTTTNVDASNENNDANNINGSKKRLSSYEFDILDKLELLDLLNKSEDVNKVFNRGSVDRDSKRWTSPESDNGKYPVTVTKNEQVKPNRAVSERGLIKVLSMLTNTFKKIMKQHNDIKEIHSKLHVINDNFMKNIEVVSDKFQDFETKYAALVSINKKIADVDLRLSEREKLFLNKERELSTNLVEFQVQQKKFLTQQKQFYDIQKLMLEQNDKINGKQNAIAKMQSEISHRQNNFARILKKAKQIYLDTKAAPKSNVIKILKAEKPANSPMTTVSETTTEPITVINVKPDTAESVKINLFSIPTVPKIRNQDHLLLNDKDEHSVDDLVYKYYFNNTFIDSLMRNFLSGFVNFGETNDSEHGMKNKRNEVEKPTTILQPVKNTSNRSELLRKSIRERRWISHHTRTKKHRRHRDRNINDNVDLDDEKPRREPRKNKIAMLSNENNNSITDNISKKTAFNEMAREFCIGIGQNATDQILSWCIEKALRKLQNIDIKIPPPPPPPPHVKAITNLFANPTPQSTFTTESSNPTQLTVKISSTAVIPSEPTAITITPQPYTPMSTYFTQTKQNYNKFFPDNEELETNLKQFDLTPDKEGNVYYDGSAHGSELLKGRNDDSDSDFLPAVDSNSRIDIIDPESFHSQTIRRALMSRLKYESLRSTKNGRKL